MEISPRLPSPPVDRSPERAGDIGPRPFRSAPEPPIEPRSSAVDVKIAWHNSSVQVIRFLDAHSGEVLSQMPAEQVLAVVDSVMKQLKEREG